MKQYCLVIDLDRCIGCKGCQVACKMENGVPIGSNRITVREVGPTGSYPDLQMYFLPSVCQQCDEPTCVQVCPTGACYKNGEDGVIYIDKDSCIGCLSCQKACPYEVNTYKRGQNVMDKCNLCADLRAEGERPACVKNCAASALIFGDINDPGSDVYVALREAGEDNVYALRDFDNAPITRYILRNAEWQDVLPQECANVKGRKGGR